MLAEKIYEDVEQGSEAWLDLRKTKITATDACAIMGVSPWKTRLQLYHEKTAKTQDQTRLEHQKRGLDLESSARSLFTIKTGVEVKPRVIVKNWTMASVDGISDCGKYLVEIKCPGKDDQVIALSAKVPDHYYPQLQHQMYVCNLEKMYYFSFDGFEGVLVEVVRDDTYIEKMLEEEWKFYQCLQNKTPPEPTERDYIQRDDDLLWKHYAEEWKSVTSAIKELELKEEDLRKQLIFLSGQSNSKGAGISLCHIIRKGNVDYSKIPELNGLDLDKYRKPESISCRITLQ